MKINSILSIFTPKDVKFFPLLKDLSAVMVKAGELLHNLVAHTEKEQRPEGCKLIKHEETAGDIITALILKELNATFITPFDREDIMELADKIEEVIDTIHRASQKILLFSPNHFTPYAVRLTELIHEGTLEIQKAVDELANMKKTGEGFRKHYKRVKSIEEEADGVYEEGITDLFRNEKDIVELVKLKDIIQELEKAANRVNSTGKVLKTVFVKYA